MPPQMVKARKPETTETDLILVAGTLTFIVATCGAAVFSHYEGGYSQGRSGVPSFLVFWLPIGLHNSCSISPMVGGTCSKD